MSNKPTITKSEAEEKIEKISKELIKIARDSKFFKDIGEENFAKLFEIYKKNTRDFIHQLYNIIPD